jgi:hypothetical protein
MERFSAVGPVAPGWADSNLTLHTHVEGTAMQPYTTPDHLKLLGLFTQAQVDRLLADHTDALREQLATLTSRNAQLEILLGEKKTTKKRTA